MKKTIPALAGLLAVQVLLAAGLGLTGPSLAAKVHRVPLLAVDTDKIDHISIEGADKAKVELAKVDGHWQLPGVSDFPADAKRVTGLIDRLHGLELGLPVATTADARKRFKVADDDFERRIIFSGDGKILATLYLGSTPAMHQLNVRRADMKGVYSVNFAVYDAPTKAENWEDTQALSFARNDIQGIDVDGLHLQQQEPPAPATKPSANSTVDVKQAEAAPPAPVWQAASLSGGQTLQQPNVDKLATQLADLRFASVLGKDEKPDYGLSKPVLTLTVTHKDGTRTDYLLGKMSSGDTYALKLSTRPQYFELTSWAGGNLVDAAKPDALVKSPEAAKPTPAKGKPKRRS